MDFFEKAHVVKRESSRKEHKSEESVKKQLKQMLHGYKHQDSKLIKSCEDTFDPTKLLDESSSVSGFSDLNLTNSSNEGDTTRGTVGSDTDDYKTSDVDESHLDTLPSYSKDNNSSDSVNISNESISEYDDKIETLSDNISGQVTLDSCSDTRSDIISLESSLEETTTDYNDVEESEFDADGALANKILEKLKTKGIGNKRGKKRKLDVKADKDAGIKFADKQKFIEEIQSENVDDSSSQCTDEKSNTEDETVENNSMNDTNSSDFVSIAPTNMPVQSLSEILGEYKYPTVRNIPESQNLHSTNNSGVFCVENLNVEDIQINDDDVENVDPTNYDLDSTSVDVVDSANLDTSQGPVSDITSNYDDTLESEDTSEKEISLESVDTNFVSPIKVFYAKSSCIFLLKHPAELFIHGKVVVTPLRGTMEIFGHTLQKEPYEVFAPNNNFAQCLKTVEVRNVNDDSLYSKLISEGLSEADAEELIFGFEDYDGIVSLKKLRSHKIDFVENSISPTDLFSRTNKNVENCFKKASEILGCSLYLTRPYKVFEDLSCWKQVIDKGFEKHSRGILCGGKGVGKSTFLRYCVNRLLARGPVLVVDLDPGQAEFTVAGNISATVVDRPLLGPNFTHMKMPNMMLNIGMINTMDNPRRYAAAVSTLITHCNKDKQLQSMPWLVNTMGMCNAMGLKFITKVILQTQPTYLVQINTRNPKKRFDTLLNPGNVMKLYEDFYYDSLFANMRNQKYDLDYTFLVENYVDSSPKSNTSLAPRDERYLNFLAYFSELLGPRQKFGLLGVTPYEVNLGDLHIGLNVRISQDAVAKVINGKIIALCQLTTLDNAGKVFTLRDKPLLCHGHGLIRGIDLERQVLFVMTPTPVDKLCLVDTLVYADWVPELRGQEQHLPDGVIVPYRAISMYQKRQLMFAPRRRFNPLQLLKMSRNS